MQHSKEGNIFYIQHHSGTAARRVSSLTVPPASKKPEMCLLLSLAEWACSDDKILGKH